MYTYEMNAGYSVMDESLCMTVPAILDCFQDAAIFESENGRINVEYLYSRHIAWILSSWQIVIDRRPRLNERIKIATAPYDFTNYVGFRNFSVWGEDGALIVRAASVWTLIDTEKLCPVRLTQELQEGYEFEPKLEMEYAPRKIALLGEAQVQDQFRVRKFHKSVDATRPPMMIMAIPDIISVPLPSPMAMGIMEITVVRVVMRIGRSLVWPLRTSASSMGIRIRSSLTPST